MTPKNRLINIDLYRAYTLFNHILR